MEKQQALAQQDQQITPEIIQKFNSITLQANHILQGFSEQSQELSNAVTGFTKGITPNPSDMVPAEKLQQFTKYYQQQMKVVNMEAAALEEILREEEEERKQLEAEMDAMFLKLQSLQQKLLEKNAKKKLQKQKMMETKQLAVDAKKPQ